MPRRSLIAFTLLFFASLAFAAPQFTALSSHSSALQNSIVTALKSQLNLEHYRELRVRVVKTFYGAPDHAVIYMLGKTTHRLELASLDIDRDGRVTTLHTGYHLQEADRTPLSAPTCPDHATQFIAFAPNNDVFEQQITEGVAVAAEAKGLKTVRLYSTQATRQSYLNYMTCPALKGNFYDGDANPQEIVTADGTLSAQDMAALDGALRHKVTNIWLACEAFNDPMLSAVVKRAAAQKYIAGINDLEVGPSDQAGACAMKAALNGQPITAAFLACYVQLDIAADQWGFTGRGSDLFGQ